MHLASGQLAKKKGSHKENIRAPMKPDMAHYPENKNERNGNMNGQNPL